MLIWIILLDRGSVENGDMTAIKRLCTIIFNKRIFKPPHLQL